MNGDITVDIDKLPVLLGESLGDTGIDLAEMAIDSILKDGVLKDLPIVGALAGLCKFGISIRERNLLKQTLTFIQEFNAGTIDPRKLERYREEISADRKKAEKELERCLIILDSTIDAVHTRLLARLFNSYVKGSISWNKFVELSDATRRLFVEDIRHLREVDRHPGENVAVKTGNAHNFFRLQSIGLLTSGTGVFRLEEGSESGALDMDSNIFKISPFGKTFIQNSGLRDVVID